MKCQDVRREIISYADGEPTGCKAQGIREHLRTCSSCAREYVAMKMTEEAVREGFQNDERENSRGGQVGKWAVRRAGRLSPAEIIDRRKWVSSLFPSAPSPSPVKNRIFSRRRGISLLVTGVLVIMLMLNWPHVIWASAQVPYLGNWVRELVLKDAGLAWAYEHGYIVDDQVTAVQDGVRFSILGTVADPIQTTVIYLLEGMGADHHVYIRTGDADVSYSWHTWNSIPIPTPLGLLGMVHTESLPEGDHDLSIQLMKGGSLQSDLTLNAVVSSELISRVSQEYVLEYQETADNLSIKTDRVVYTPTQIRVDYVVSGGSDYRGIVAVGREDIYLSDAEGNRISRLYSSRTQRVVGEWECYDVFHRPQAANSLSMNISTWGYYEDAGLAPAPDDALDILVLPGGKGMLGAEAIFRMEMVSEGESLEKIGWSLKTWYFPQDYDQASSQEKPGGSPTYGFSLADSESDKSSADGGGIVIKPVGWTIPLPQGR